MKKMELVKGNEIEFLYRQCSALSVRGIDIALERVDVNHNNGRPLMYVITSEGSNYEKKLVIEHLIKKGANINIRDGVALTWAVQENNLELVRFLISKMKNGAKQDGGMPVFYAAQRGQTEILKLLLQHGAQQSADKEIIECLSQEAKKLLCEIQQTIKRETLSSQLSADEATAVALQKEEDQQITGTGIGTKVQKKEKDQGSEPSDEQLKEYEYSDGDILSYVTAVISSELGGLKEGCRYLLKKRQSTQEGRERLVAFLDAINVSGMGAAADADAGVVAAPVEYFFNKHKRPDDNVVSIQIRKLLKYDNDKLIMEVRNNALEVVRERLQDEAGDTRSELIQCLEDINKINSHDVFDEIISNLMPAQEDQARIIFPYNTMGEKHWVTGEINIIRTFQEGSYNYHISLTAHDPYGGGKINDANIENIRDAISARIKEEHNRAFGAKDIAVNFAFPESQYQKKRQNDRTSCGVITAEEIVARIKDGGLEEDYPAYALELRKKQINFMSEKYGKARAIYKSFIAGYLSVTREEAPLVDREKLGDMSAWDLAIALQLQFDHDRQLHLREANSKLGLKPQKASSHAGPSSASDSTKSTQLAVSYKSNLSAFTYYTSSTLLPLQPIDSFEIIKDRMNKVLGELPTEEFLYDIGKEFIELEKRSEYLKQLGYLQLDNGEKIRNDSKLLEVIKLAIYYAKSFIGERSKVFLGVIGACSHELISRKSNYIREHSGIPWKAMAHLHRVISEDIRETKLLPRYSFTEGIYYDEALYQKGLGRIIDTDLGELYNSIQLILTKKLYYQVFPISNHILLLYQFYYNECHLQFLRYASESILERLNIDSAIPDLNLPYYNAINSQGFFLYIINIGEAFNALSYNVEQYFNQEITTVFKKARNLLAHPEEEKNQEKIKKLLSEEATIYTFLNIEKDKFIKEIKLIHKQSVELLQKEYNYKFNIEVNEISFFSIVQGSDIDNPINPWELPKPAQRIIAACENMARMSRGTFEKFALSYEIRPIEDILKTDHIIQDFIASIVFSLKIDMDINYRSCIQYLKHYLSSFNEVFSQDSKSQSEAFFLENYNYILECTGDFLENGNESTKHIRYQLIFIEAFESEENKKIKKYFIKINSKFLENLEKIHHTFELSRDFDELAFLTEIYLGHFPDSKKAKRFLKAFKKESKTKKDRLKEINQEPIDDDLFDRSEETVDSTQVNKIQKEAELAVQILKQIDKAYREFSVVYTIYEDSLRGDAGSIMESISGPIVWYYTILMGSLSRYLLEKIDLISLSDQPRFKIFFKAYFQVPRGDIAHNQVPLIGEEDYIKSIKSHREGSAGGHLIITGPESIVLEGLQKDKDGDYYMEAKPWKDFPASRLKVDSLLEHHHVKRSFEWLNLLAMAGKRIYQIIYLTRNTHGEVSVDFYLSDKPFNEDEADREKLIKDSIGCISLPKEICDKYLDDTTPSELYFTQEFFRKIMSENIEVLKELRSRGLGSVKIIPLFICCADKKQNLKAEADGSKSFQSNEQVMIPDEDDEFQRAIDISLTDTHYDKEKELEQFQREEHKKYLANQSNNLQARFAKVTYTNQILNDYKILELYRLVRIYAGSKGINKLIDIGCDPRSYEALQAFRSSLGDEKAIELLMEAAKIGGDDLLNLVLDLPLEDLVSVVHEQGAEIILYRLLGVEMVAQKSLALKGSDLPALLDKAYQSSSETQVQDDSAPQMLSAAPIKQTAINNWISSYLKGWIYRAELKQLGRLLQHHNIDVSAEEALSSKGFRKLSLKLHPDKGGNKEDFAFVSDLKAKFDADVDVRAVIDPIIRDLQLKAHKLSVGSKLLDAAVDALRLYLEPTVPHFKAAVLDATHLCSITLGFSKVSSAATLLSVGHTYYSEGLAKAASQGVVSLGHMAVPYALTFTGIPYIGFAYGVSMAVYSVGHVLYNAYSLYSEYTSEQSELRSATAYMAMFKRAASFKPDWFEGKALEYKIKVNSIKLQMEQEAYQERLKVEGEFGQKIYEHIYEPYLQEKYSLLDKVVLKELELEAANKQISRILVKFKDLEDYDLCREVSSNDSSKHYYCANEEKQLLQHIAIAGGTVQVIESV